MPPAQNISALGFRDYVRIRRLVHADGKNPTIEVTQHNKDTVTYVEAYGVIEDVINELEDYVQRTNEYTTNLVSALCGTLYDRHLVSKKDVEQIGQIAEKLWKDNEEKKNE